MVRNARFGRLGRLSSTLYGWRMLDHCLRHHLRTSGNWLLLPPVEKILISNLCSFRLQDKVDDLLVGIKSTALRFGENTKLWLSSFSTAMITGLLTSGYVCDQTLPYYLTVGVVGAHLAQQIASVNIDNPTDCAKKFISNHQVGFLIFAGIVLGTYWKASQEKPNPAGPTPSPTPLMKLAKDKMHITWKWTNTDFDYLPLPTKFANTINELIKASYRSPLVPFYKYAGKFCTKEKPNHF